MWRMSLKNFVLLFAGENGMVARNEIAKTPKINQSREAPPRGGTHGNE
jgi:hypothetical protein